MSAPPSEDLPQLDNWEIARYSRHLILDEVGMTGQRKLKGAKVLCVGTGGAFNQFWREKDLRDLTGMCGLEGFERRRSRQFILFRVNKPL